MKNIGYVAPVRNTFRSSRCSQKSWNQQSAVPQCCASLVSQQPGRGTALPTVRVSRLCRIAPPAHRLVPSRSQAAGRGSLSIPLTMLRSRKNYLRGPITEKLRKALQPERGYWTELSEGLPAGGIEKFLSIQAWLCKTVSSPLIAFLLCCSYYYFLDITQNL